jgi:hypothetical protein
MLLSRGPSRLRSLKYEPTQQQLKANEARAFLLALGNFVFALAVLAATAINVPQGVDKGLLAIFLPIEICLILVYMFMCGWDLAARVADEIAGNGPNGAREWTPAPLNQLLPIWLVVAVNFMPVAYLIHMTGGPASSPYISLPPTMLLIGQLLKKGGAPRQRGLVLPVVRFFRVFLSIGLLFYCALFAWEALAPETNSDLRTTAVAVVITFGLYFVATWTNYFSLSRNFRDESPPVEKEKHLE